MTSASLDRLERNPVWHNLFSVPPQLSPHSKAKPTSQFTNESKVRPSCSLMQPLIAKKTRHSLKSSSNYQSKLDMEFRCNNDGRENVSWLCRSEQHWPATWRGTKACSWDLSHRSVYFLCLKLSKMDSFLKERGLSMMEYIFNPSNWEIKVGGPLEFEANIIEIVSYRPAAAT